MIKVLRARIFQKYRTIKFPKTVPQLPERYLGIPKINQDECKHDCAECIEVCPVGAISKISGIIDLDLGKCIFCGKCSGACSGDAIVFSKDYRMAVTDRSSLCISEKIVLRRAETLNKEMLRIFKRSLRLRQVSAGGCNACEADVNVLGTVGWDLDRFGIKFVASPRHADGLLVTGSVTKNMRKALLKAYEAVPEPKIVIAVGSCALSGGLFISHDETGNGVDTIIPVDLYIPGCPPHPLTILDGLLRILGRC
ncbi:MAG: NADH-quinone oxidoreductase subunit NuoB [Spirochaetales bacterium]|nr:NADH-quinone oxidoreductase subunit NuoB [Spirochaetales bacterium]